MRLASMRTRALRASTLSIESSRQSSQSTICAQCRFKQSLGRLYRSTNPLYLSPVRRKQSTWAAAVSAVQNTFSEALPIRPASSAVTADPLRVVAKELKFLNKNIRNLLGSGHPILDTVAKYYTQSEGKHVRPLLVLLMSRATATTTKQPHRRSLSSSAVNAPISSPSVLYDDNPDQSPLTDPSLDSNYAFSDDFSVLPSQRRLAEITELIHTASLLHDDVIDHSTTRRSAPSANTMFGNKMAVL